MPMLPDSSKQDATRSNASDTYASCLVIINLTRRSSGHLGTIVRSPRYTYVYARRCAYAYDRGWLWTTDPKGPPDMVDVGAAAPEGTATGAVPAEGAVPDGAVPEGVGPRAAAAAAAADVTSRSACAAAPPPQTESAAADAETAPRKAMWCATRTKCVQGTESAG